ncbi:LysR substrate-binding domain-containing protein [Bosea vestrisii]|uniref:LysR substrate-binding domain-containing protein n=1 Tax=Bosea vestrisii TaxID=151416 RepID=A0ABW0HBJ1_9HYPH
MPALAVGMLARFLAQFLRLRPNVRPAITGVPSYHVIDAVSSGQADLGYANSPTAPPGLETNRIEVPAVVVLPLHHELARQDVIAPQDLAGERLVGLLAGTLFRSQIDVALAGFGCDVFIETQLSHIACLLVSEGAGICIVDPYAALEFEMRGLAIRRFSPGLDAGFVCIRSERQPASLLATSFAEEFGVHIRTLMAPFRE